MIIWIYLQLNIAYLKMLITDQYGAHYHPDLLLERRNSWYFLKYISIYMSTIINNTMLNVLFVCMKLRFKIKKGKRKGTPAEMHFLCKDIKQKTDTQRNDANKHQ